MSNRAVIIGSVLITGVLFSVSFFTSTTSPVAPRASASTSKVHITMDPKSGSLDSGPQTVSVILQSSDASKISGIDLSFNTTGNLSIVDVYSPVSFPGGDESLFSEIITDIQDTSARISYVAVIPTEQLPTAVKVQVIVEAQGAGSGTLSIDTSATQIVGKTQGYDFELGTVDSATFGQTQANQQQSSAKSLTLSVRFQGVEGNSRQSNITLPVKATLVKQSSGDYYEYTVFVKPVGQGVWQGTAPISAPAGNDYILFVKGPQHLRKKICSNTISQTNTICNTATFTIQNAENKVDLSALPLYAGDVQGGGIEQDGIIDASDVAYIRTNFGSTQPAVLSQIDLNFDGIIDTQDYSLLLSSLDYRVDEE